MKVNVLKLRQLAERLSDPKIQADLLGIAKEKGVVAIIGQAIGNNFDKEGPDWEPLKPSTIRASVARAIAKGLGTDEDIKENEAKFKRGGKRNQKKDTAENQPTRRILQRTGLLRATATTPGTSSAGGKSGSNIYRVEGTNVIWGTDLVYARIHNQGGTIEWPGTNKGFGVEGKVLPPHNIKIPKREFLVIRQEFKDDLKEYMLSRAMDIIKKTVGTT